MPEMDRQNVRKHATIFAELEELSQESGFIYSFLVMVARFLWMSADEVADINWKERPNQAELSLLLGLVVKHTLRLDEFPSENTIFEQVQGTTELLRELQHVLSTPTLSLKSQDTDPRDQITNLRETYEDWMSRGVGLVEPIFYGGEGAYDFQYLEMASKKYAADERWFLENKGANIEEFIEITNDLERLTLEHLQDI